MVAPGAPAQGSPARMSGRSGRVRDWRDALHAAPVVPLDALVGPGGALVIAPHPDDETLGCGGLIAALAAVGRPVAVAVLTDGAASHPRSAAYPAPRLTALRERETRDALAHLGAAGAPLRFLRHPDGGLGTADTRASAEALAAWAGALGRPTLFVTWDGDPHPDHKAAFALARRVQARTGLPLRAYPVWALTLPGEAPLDATLGPIARFDVGAHLAAKRRAAMAHRSQVEDLIADDPSGFRLTPDQLALFITGHETFIAVPPSAPESERSGARALPSR